jgi:NTE family protein
MQERKKVALVLSGGGALGCAHIGVIKALEKYNIPVDIVVGTSMGGIVGAAYSAGLSTDEMLEFACKFKTINFLDVNFDNSGLFSGKGVMKIINKFIPDTNIEFLPRTFACVSADLYTDKEVVFKTGSLRDAVRATISIPGIFVPFPKDDMLLIDGGVVNNLPEDVAMEMGADVIISCDVISDCRITKKPKNAFVTLFYSIFTSTKEIQKLKAQHSDILIRPNMSGLTPFSYGAKEAKLAVKRGEKETLKYIEEISRLIKGK